jgi:hypothetical protein
VLPVDAAEPGVLLEVGHVLQPGICFLLEKFTEEVLEVVAPVFVEVGFVMFDLIEQFTSVFGVEGRETMDEFVDERAQTPPVNCFAVSFFLYDLRGEVFRGSAD